MEDPIYVAPSSIERWANWRRSELIPERRRPAGGVGRLRWQRRQIWEEGMSLVLAAHGHVNPEQRGVAAHAFSIIVGPVDVPLDGCGLACAPQGR